MNFNKIMALVLILGCLGYAFAITFIPIPQTSIRFADTLTGIIIGGVLVQVVGFYYGNSEKTHVPDNPPAATPTNNDNSQTT